MSNEDLELDAEGKTQEEIAAEFEEWVITRPEHVRKMLREYPPYKLYTLKSTNHIIQLFSYDEDKNTGMISFTVLVLHRYNLDLNFERRVFGIEAEDLEMVNDNGYEYETIGQDPGTLH